MSMKGGVNVCLLMGWDIYTSSSSMVGTSMVGYSMVGYSMVGSSMVGEIEKILVHHIFLSN